MQQVVECGNLSDGFTVVGPFADPDAASAWAEGCRRDWLMMDLSPEGKGTHVVLHGDFSHGFRVAGPFAHEKSERTWKNQLRSKTAWIARLCAPNEYEE